MGPTRSSHASEAVGVERFVSLLISYFSVETLHCLLTVFITGSKEHRDEAISYFTTRLPRLCNDGVTKLSAFVLDVNEDLETAIHHAFHVEGHLLRAHLFHLFHHLCIDAVAVRPGLVNDP